MSDVFGKALMAYHRGGEAVHHIEREDGYFDPMETGFYFSDHEAWFVGDKAALMEVKGGNSGCRVRCGEDDPPTLGEGARSGCHRRLPPLALEVSRLRGVRNCRLMDVRALDFPEAFFDTVVMYGNNFGIGGGVEETRVVLQGLNRMTKERMVGS